MTSKRTDQELEDLRENIKKLIEKIEKTIDFKPQPSHLCDWCEFHNGEDVDTDWVDDNETKGGKLDKEDAAEETYSSTREVSEAWHQARDDAQEDGDLPEREANKNKDDD